LDVVGGGLLHRRGVPKRIRHEMDLFAAVPTAVLGSVSVLVQRISRPAEPVPASCSLVQTRAIHGPAVGAADVANSLGHPRMAAAPGEDRQVAKRLGSLRSFAFTNTLLCRERFPSTACTAFTFPTILPGLRTTGLIPWVQMARMCCWSKCRRARCLPTRSASCLCTLSICRRRSTHSRHTESGAGSLQSNVKDNLDIECGGEYPIWNDRKADFTKFPHDFSSTANRRTGSTQSPHQMTGTAADFARLKWVVAATHL
jgi:hypothetical protein